MSFDRIGTLVVAGALAVLLFTQVAPQIFMLGATGYMVKKAGDAIDSAAAGPPHVSAKRREYARLTDSAKALNQSAAMPGESARGTQRVDVVLIDHTQAHDTQWGDEAAYREIGLDLSQLRRGAGVIIAEIPIRWQVRGHRPELRGRLGFEGKGAVELDPLPQGLVAGTRLAPSGTTRPTLEIDRASYRFCSSMIEWSQQFGVPERNMYVWKLFLSAGDTMVTLKDGGVRASRGHVRSLGTAGRICEHRRS